MSRNARMEFCHVDRDHRISVAATLFESVSWLAPGEEANVELCLLLGSDRALTMAPADRAEQIFAPVERLLQAGLIDHDVRNEEWAGLMHLAASAWMIRMHRHGARLRLTFPEDPRRLGLLPDRSGAAVVFVCGDLVQLWEASEWTAHLRRAAANVASLRELASTALR